jgi:type IV secretion system protein VirD4
MRFRVLAASVSVAWVNHVPTLAPILILVSLLTVAPKPAAAEIPRATLERLADIRVEMTELRHLNNIEKITKQEYNRRSDVLTKERAALSALFGHASQEDQINARTTIDGLVNAKLALLIPQWQKAEAAFKDTRERRQKQLYAEVEEDARRAAELQRQRLLLQKQLDAGAIPRDAFADKDRQALDGVAAIRKKYETIGGFWPQQFDNRLAQATKAVVASPNTPLPQSQVPAAGAAQSPLDFDRDVKLAAAIAVKQQELHFQFEKEQVSSDAFRESDVVYDRDLSRLKLRYQAISVAREQQFESAYRRLAEPQLQALRIQYYPEKYRPNTVSAPAPNPPGIFETMSALIVLFGGGGLIVVFVVWFIRANRRAGVFVPPLTRNYGTAKWAAYQQKPVSKTAVSEGVTFGKSSHPTLPADAIGAPIVSTAETHTLIVAKTGAGKGTRVIVPTLLRYSDSMMVFDPKGENAAITARTRRDQLKQAVHILNPWGVKQNFYESLGFQTATFNPLDAVDRNDPNAVANAQMLSKIICPVVEGKEKFWQGSAANILAAVFLWLADQPGEEKTLARARHIVTRSRKDLLEFIVKMAASTAFRGGISEMMSQLLDLSSDSYGNIFINLNENTQFISDIRIKDSTASSSFSMRTFRDTAATVYLVVPDDYIKDNPTWLRLVLSAAMQGLKGRDTKVQPRHRCMFLIDEFGSLGHMDDIPKNIALMRGHGLDYTLVIQDLNQLKEHYGAAHGTILSNCAYKWFCQNRDLETAKYLSECLGQATVRTVGKSESSGEGAGGATAGSSTTYGEMGRSLLTPAEIMNLTPDVAILLGPVDLPHYLRPVDYWKLSETFTPLKDEYPHFYWKPPLTYDENPYFKKEPPPGGTGSQDQSRNRPPPRPKTGMSEKEAREILGVAADAKRDDIYAAYKRLMLKVHPDTGGSNHFARQLNEAKELLLGK